MVMIHRPLASRTMGMSLFGLRRRTDSDSASFVGVYLTLVRVSCQAVPAPTAEARVGLELEPPRLAPRPCILPPHEP
jgi:hypothetical protein